MSAGCGINAWETNSQIVHITSHSPLGPYQRQNLVWPIFAHEPDVVRAPNGDWVMMYSAYPYNETGLARVLCHCSNVTANGSTPSPGTPGCPFQRGQPKDLGHPFQQMLAVASEPTGPWRQVEITRLTTAWDWNTALVINKDDSAIGLIRGGMVVYADNYTKPTAWHPVGGTGAGFGPQWTMNGGVEDPYLWQDSAGVYHALAHAFDPW